VNNSQGKSFVMQAKDKFLRIKFTHNREPEISCTPHFQKSIDDQAWPITNDIFTGVLKQAIKMQYDNRIYKAN
jgi:hypothetical protein